MADCVIFGNKTIPVIDLFAGPGGLGEGFSSLRDKRGIPSFDVKLSIEKDSAAHRTLVLRAVFRYLKSLGPANEYYEYIRGKISLSDFKKSPGVAEAFVHAERQARCLELGKCDEADVDDEIKNAVGEHQDWVLVGGPPCQAYSLAGRSRRARDKSFHKDEKHFLYKEYLRIIKRHKPTAFVMENVKGLLSSNHSGQPMFQRILTDLASPENGLEYEIRSFVQEGEWDSLEPTDYLVRSEQYGIPQCRHRVILLGVRKGLYAPAHEVLQNQEPVTVEQAIGDLPPVRSKLSRGDSLTAWREALSDAPHYLTGWHSELKNSIRTAMQTAAVSRATLHPGAAFMNWQVMADGDQTELGQWLSDPVLGGVCQHEARGHMKTDLARYLFASTFASKKNHSPLLQEFPPNLLPNHANVRQKKKSKTLPFNDRFRVQRRSKSSATIVSHIAKDGHYYIHYDPSQCRSLTVREAARLQTFPDNYFFEGNRTQQYTQVGNAVPPLLAFKLARIVGTLLHDMNERGTTTQCQETMRKKDMNIA